MADPRTTPPESKTGTCSASDEGEHPPAAPGRRRSSIPETPEPDLITLLDEPEVRLLMRADHVDREELLAMLDHVKLELRGHAASPDQRTDDARYRPGVGIVLLSAQNRIFMGQRSDVSHEAWQMPQGGIDAGETPWQAALRELKEEIGTNDVEVIAEADAWLYYDVPEQLARRAWAGRWIGQRQKWFVMLFKGLDTDINVATEHPEFRAWRWVEPEALTEFAAPFKRELYAKILGQFATLFRD